MINALYLGIESLLKMLVFLFRFQWHSLSREEQAKYYEMARKERQLHMQLYPGWSARDNYALQVKKKKRKKDRNQDGGKQKKPPLRPNL